MWHESVSSEGLRATRRQAFMHTYDRPVGGCSGRRRLLPSALLAAATCQNVEGGSAGLRAWRRCRRATAHSHLMQTTYGLRVLLFGACRARARTCPCSVGSSRALCALWAVCISAWAACRFSPAVDAAEEWFSCAWGPYVCCSYPGRQAAPARPNTTLAINLK